MEYQEVLILKYQEVFDKVAVRIVYQDTGVLKRGSFRDEELKVFSISAPHYLKQSNKLYIRGKDTESDNDIILVDKEDVITIKQRVEKINQKYGKYKRWRGNFGDKYYCIKVDSDIYIEKVEEILCNEIDDNLYEMGNYFKTKEEAQKIVDKIEEIFKNIRDGVNK